VIASGPPAVALSGVSKAFRLPLEQFHTLKERVLHPFRASRFTALRAVDDVSLEIASGEFFGIVGRNGSGKSTLLKCLAGIYEIDQGSIAIHGRLSPFIELGVGFNQELTARDNVIINAIMLGLSRKQAYERFDDIVAFAELDGFMDLKLKNYSSGMQVRLAFSVAIQVDAQIVLIDEVLAVGDAAFQQKCYDEFVRMKEEGRTIIFVTHDMGAVERFCDRAMLMEEGRVVDVGEPAEIARKYNQLNFRRAREEPEVAGGPDLQDMLRAAPVAEVMNAVFESPTGETLVTAIQGEPCTVRMEVRFHADIENPIFAIVLRNDAGHAVFAASTVVDPNPTGWFRAGEIAVIRIRFENWLGPGRYRLTASVARAGLGDDLLDRHEQSSVIVLAERPVGGETDLPNTIEIERVRS
jgi:ABC-type polysaccharide/polyol phosphate transport system ATPase subunit